MKELYTFVKRSNIEQISRSICLVFLKVISILGLVNQSCICLYCGGRGAHDLRVVVGPSPSVHAVYIEMVPAFSYIEMVPVQLH